MDQLGLTTDTLARLGIDLVAIALLAHAVYFRRHRDRELLVALSMFNVGLFVALQVISAGSVGIGVGFGLFAILSILRLRSEPLGFVEIAYFFAALVLALATGIDVGGLLAACVLGAIVIAAAVVADSPSLVRPVGRTEVTLEMLFVDGDLLRRHLEERLDASILRADVVEIDFVRETTRVEVRYRPAPAPAPVSEEVLRASVAEPGR